VADLIATDAGDAELWFDGLLVGSSDLHWFFTPAILLAHYISAPNIRYSTGGRLYLAVHGGNEEFAGIVRPKVDGGEHAPRLVGVVAKDSPEEVIVVAFEGPGDSVAWTEGLCQHSTETIQQRFEVGLLPGLARKPYLAFAGFSLEESMRWYPPCLNPP
jgi:hypothetical protein